MKLFALLLASLPLFTFATFQPDGVPFLAPVTVGSGLSASVIFSNLTAPRGITFDSKQNLLVIERGFGVTAFSRVASPIAGWERTVVVSNTGLTQGIQVDGERLYVSTAGEVLVYKYNPITKTASLTSTTLISGVPADGELTTHTLELERGSTGVVTAILVASGPLTNIDITARNPASGRSQIRRFPLILTSTAPLLWSNGQVIAYGIRNPAGFAFESGPSIGLPNQRKLYVVENGASIDEVTGITPAFANDNPADELELVTYSTSSSNTLLPRSYGFPDCTTIWNPNADPVGAPQYTTLTRGDQFSLNLDATHDDAWCQVKSNNQPPAFNFQAHSVPLDIKFYQPNALSSIKSIPTDWANDAFVSFRGSFNRSPPTGYGVVRVPTPLSDTGLGSALGYYFLIQATDLNSCPGKCIRPVGLAFGADNRLYVSSDSSRELFVIEASA